ncbi:MAG: hypothetical protein ACP5TZ_05160 [Nitrososphaeria archaeon]
MKVMGGNLVSLNPEIYAVWTRGCKDPARYLFAYVPDAHHSEKSVFDSIRLKFSHDIYVVVSEKSIMVNGKLYDLESGETPEGDVVRLFMELVRKHENLI